MILAVIAYNPTRTLLKRRDNKKGPLSSNPISREPFCVWYFLKSGTRFCCLLANATVLQIFVYFVVTLFISYWYISLNQQLDCCSPTHCHTRPSEKSELMVFFLSVKQFSTNVLILFGILSHFLYWDFRGSKSGTFRSSNLFKESLPDLILSGQFPIFFKNQFTHC